MKAEGRAKKRMPSMRNPYITSIWFGPVSLLL